RYDDLYGLLFDHDVIAKLTSYCEAFKRVGAIAVKVFFYLTLVHEAAELSRHLVSDTFGPDRNSELNALVSELEAYHDLFDGEKRAFKNLFLEMEKDPLWTHRFLPLLKLFERFPPPFHYADRTLRALLRFISVDPIFKGAREIAHEFDLFRKRFLHWMDARL